MPLAAAMVVLGVAPAADAQVFDPKTFTLDNGLTVVLIENHRVPVVTHMVWYKVGSSDEQAGESGAAHFFEHLMFKGTDKVPPGAFSKIVARNGGRDNAFNSYDFPAYFQNLATDRLELVMELEADRMTNLRLTPAEIEPERAVVLEERRSRTDNNPGSLLSEEMMSALFVNHPQRRPIIGWEHEIRGLTRDGLEAFYRKWYAPNNAIVVVAGDVTLEELRPLVEKHYGPIPRGPEMRRGRAVEPPHRAERRVVLRSDRVRQPEVRRLYLAPSYRAGASEHAYALQVLADVIGGRATSRLYRRLVVEDKLAVGAGAYYDPLSFDLSTFGIYATPSRGVDVAELEKAIEGLLDRLLAEGVSADEVERSKKRLVAEAVFARDGLMGGARVLGSALAVDHSIAASEAWPERIRAVTAEEVSAAARAVLDRRASVTGFLLPEAPPAAAGTPAPEAPRPGHAGEGPGPG
ncbi:MAG: insulinase family protein [Proteobacteria bacterium]|nr:insulinase family protein [Pseudomonadota bacterium]